MEELIEKDLVFRIVGCALEIHNALGHGFREKTYENALIEEFLRQGIDCKQQTRFPVYYRKIQVDEFIPDLVVEGKVIVDTKCVDRIIDDHRGTMLNYLRVTGIRVGVIINFKHARLGWERLVLDKVR